MLVVHDSRIENAPVGVVFKPVAWIGVVRAGVVIPVEACISVFVRWWPG